METEERSRKLDIRPFRHQISGQVGMFALGSEIVLKPATSREAAFYSSVPHSLLPFTAKFKGILEVPVDSEHARMFASLLRRASLRPRRSGEAGEERPGQSKTTSAEEEEEFEEAEGNPWGLSCQRRLAVSALAPNSVCLRFLQLENLVRGYELPCILDLKMGTQQWGPWASEEKRRRKSRRSLDTTSARLGLRLINKQVLLPNGRRLSAGTGKAHGRALREDSLGEEIRSFVRPPSGEGQANLSEAFIHRLEKLQRVMKEAESHRFFCSSLLLLYDGAKPRAETVQVKMIDFAHWTGPPFDSASFQGPDEGLLLGLESLLRLLRQAPSFSLHSSTPSHSSSTSNRSTPDSTP